MKEFIYTSILVLILGGCFSNDKTPRTYDYFKKNIKVAHQVVQECNNIGVQRDEFTKIECTNATEAVMKNFKKPNRDNNNYKMGF